MLASTSSCQNKLQISMCMQATTTYASNTGNTSSIRYPHYEMELGFTNGITPAFVTSFQRDIPCAFCWGAFYYLCAHSLQAYKTPLPSRCILLNN